MTQGNIDTYLWVEKYRPKTLQDLVIDNVTRKQFETYIRDKQIPNLLFYGGPGCGKSTTARILCDHIIPQSTREMDVMYLNGSEQRGISVIREMVIEFLKYKSMSGYHKIVFIDEADYLTDESFSALRNIYEKYYNNGRFLLTCNYIHKIPEAIRSRSTEFKFKEMPNEYVLKYCYKILENENIKYESKDVEKIVLYGYPDMRKIIQNLQRFSSSGILTINSDKELIDLEDTVVIQTIDLIKKYLDKDINGANNRVNDIINICTQNELDYIIIFKKLFEDKRVLSSIKILSNQYMNSLNKAVFPNMHYISFIFDTIEKLKFYHSK